MKKFFLELIVPVLAGVVGALLCLCWFGVI